MLETHDEREWKETARWIKYEEDVEEGVDRWGKPHVASLSFHSLLNLRRCLEEGLVLLDLEEKDLPAIAYRWVISFLYFIITAGGKLQSRIGDSKADVGVRLWRFPAIWKRLKFS